MEAVGAVANVIAVVDLSAKVATLCYRYSQDVSSARADIERLRRQAEHLQITLNAAKTLVEKNNSPQFSTSTTILKAFDSCRTDLEYVLKKLDPNLLRTAMRRYGWRSLKWPFKSKEIDQLLAELKSYENTISMGLQLDQCEMLESIKEGVDRLQLPPTENAMAYKKRHLMIPFTPDPDFIHRPSIQEWMKDQFSRPCQRLALVGMGGFGKSKLAIQFGHQVFNESGSSVFWIHGGNKAGFEESYRALADLLGLPRRHESEVNILALVRDWLQRDDIHPWFMIVDNADDGKVFFSGKDSLASYLPKSINGKILATSRSLNTAQKLVGNIKMIYRIHNMAEDQALDLLQSLLETRAHQNDARDLVYGLDFIPLAIKQAAAYINRCSPRVTTKSYLKDFFKSEKRKVNLLLSDKGDLDRQDGVSNSVVITWQVTFKQIRDEHPSAANLLSLMSQFQAQNIPEFMLHRYNDDPFTGDGEDCGREEENERIAFEKDLDILRSYSLVSLSAEDHFSMHSLVQFCTRRWISQLGDSGKWTCLFIKLAANHFPIGDFENWRTCQLLLPHVESVLSTEPNQQSAIEYWAKLLYLVSYYFRMIGQHSRAHVLAEMSVQATSNSLGQESVKTLERKSNLAAILSELGKFKEAHELRAELVEKKKAKLGANHKSTLDEMSNLSIVLSDQGRLDEAERLSIEVLERRRATLGLEHPDTLVFMNSLALVLQDLGRLQEAESLQLEVLAKTRKVLGHHHLHTLTSMSNLAVTLSELGKLQEAERLQVEVLAKRQEALGNDHPATGRIRGNLALTLLALGRLQEAKKLQVDQLRRLELTVGRDHPETLTSISNLALIMRHQGRSKEAEELQLEALQGRKVSLGVDHPYTLFSMECLAFIWHDQGRLKEALFLIQDSACLREEKLGYTHPDTQLTLRTLQEWRAEIPLPEEIDEEVETENL